ncbi:hypothetical protein [Streptomyces sp. NBC_00986]|uniref:hypothetical protein n=1 Tax=Streptomyces sp. NBC_00986 TaxID=2903702 RepID=UPI003868B0CF|nr:hypothetical protein OG504_45240 [Streptomyces sp. NBC_00986]
MDQARALPAEPRRSSGGAGGAARGQWTTTPMRIVWGADAYADADTKVYVKVKALTRGRPCTASVERLAEYTGLAPSTVEKALSRLSRPAPPDGITELTRRQRSHEVTGNGRTNERTCRALGRDERYVSAPVLAADTLRGTLHRLYLLLRYTEIVERRQLTLAEIAWVLRHHSGKRVGLPLAEAVVTRLLAELAGLGWITLDRRAGYRGRHLVTVHDDPVHPVDGPEPTPDAEGGAAPDLEGGALAYKEDHSPLNDLGTTTEAGDFRRRRAERKWAAGPVDNAAGPLAPVAATFRPAPAVRPLERPAYAGPPFTLSRDAWTLLGPVLEPVSDLLPRISPYMTRRIVRELLRQIREDGIWPEEIRDQITRMRRWTPDEDITDPGRWLLGAVLPVRSRCGMTGCHWGFLAHTGMPCKACAESPTGRVRGQPPPATPTQALLACPGCDAPYRPPLRHTNCRLCHTDLTDTA